MECVRHSDIVYNLVGRDYETKNFTFEHVHVDGSRAIAEAAAEAGVARFVQVSALNASEDSTSKFLRSKVQLLGSIRMIVLILIDTYIGFGWKGCSWSASWCYHCSSWYHVWSRRSFLEQNWSWWWLAILGQWRPNQDSSCFGKLTWIDICITSVLIHGYVRLLMLLKPLKSCSWLILLLARLMNFMGKWWITNILDISLTLNHFSPKEYTYQQVYELAREIALKPLPIYPLPLPIAK